MYLLMVDVSGKYVTTCSRHDTHARANAQTTLQTITLASRTCNSSDLAEWLKYSRLEG